MGNSTEEQGHIRGTALVDLTGFKAEKDFAAISKISGVGVVLVPEHLSYAAARIPMEGVGAVVPVPEGRKVSVQTGLIKLSAPTLVNAKGHPSDVLVLVGQGVITGVPATVGLEIIVIGSLLAPKAAEPQIAAAVTRTTGTLLYYENDNLRLFHGDHAMDKSFFELLPEPITMAIVGQLTLEDDVTVTMLQQKVSEIILVGHLNMPRHLRSIVQVLATAQLGSIKIREDDDPPFH